MTRSRALVRTLVLIPFLMCLISTAFAQQRWVLSPFQPPDNLPFEEVRDITETPDGSLWLTSWSGGVARLHGSDWSVYTASEGLVYDYVRTVTPDSGNGVWIGTDHGISHVYNGKVVSYTPETLPIMPEALVSVACRLSNGTVWFGTYGGAVFACDDVAGALPASDESQDVFFDSDRRRWRVVLPLDESNPRDAVLAITEASDGSIWLGMDDYGVMVYRGGTWEHIPSDAFAAARVKSIVEARDGRMWIAGGGPPCYWDGKSWSIGGMVEILCLAESPGGELVGGTAYGMSYLDGDTWREVPTVREIGRPLVRTIHFTQTGDAWVGTKEGIIRLRKPKWQWVSHSPAETSFNDGHAFYASPDQPPLAVDWQNRLVEYVDEGWRVKCHLPGPAEPLQFLSQPLGDTVYVLNGPNVYECDLDDCTVRNRIPLPSGISPEGIVQTRHGELLVWGAEGALKYSSGDWIPYPGKSRDDELQSLVETPRGELLACFESSVERWKDGKVVFQLGGADVQARYGMNCALERRNGELWMGARGLYIYNAESGSFVTARDGLISDRIFQILECSDGTIWTGSEHKGVSSYRDGRWVSFSHGDGLPNEKLIALGEYPAGTIWVATRNGGLYRYRPTSGTPDTRIVASPDDLAPKSAAVFSFTGYDAWDSTLQEELEYSWRIVPQNGAGYEPAWSPFSRVKTIAVPPLAPGHYVFEVRAADKDRDIDPTPARAAVHVLNPLWMRYEFLVPMMLLVVLAVGLTVIIVRKAEALAQSEKSYRAIFDAVSDAIFVRDARSGEVLDANDRSTKLFGFERAEFLKADLSGKLYKDTEGYRRQLEAANHEPAFAEVTARRKDGSTFDAELRLARASIGGAERLLETVRDITERRKAEAEVRRLAMAVEQAAEVIVITDVNGTIEYVNPAFQRLTGYTREEAIGQNPRLLKSGKHSDAFYERMWHIVQTGEVWTGHFTNRKKEGSLYEQETSITALKDRDGRIVNYVAVGKDVSREVRMEARLRQSQKLEAIGTLAGGIAHDFNNILSPILGFTEIVKDELAEGTDSRANLEEVLRAGSRAKDLVHQILTFSRQTETERSPVRVHQIVIEALKLLRATIPPTIEIRQEVDPDSGEVFADPTLVHQVVMNLGTNAYHAMEQAGGVMDVSLKVDEVPQDLAASHPRLRTGQPYICLSVTDTGVGMDRATLERIFDPFFTTKDLGKGTGLGLATVHGIVLNMGGDIVVTSESGKGSRFTVYLPQMQVKTVEASPTAETIPSGNGQHVLLVDDEQAVLDFTRQLLIRLGYQVTPVSDSRKALELFRESSGLYDAIITDHAMPEVTGAALAAEVLRIRPEVPVILITGFSESMSPEYARAQGIAEFLQKPFTRAALANALNRALATEDGRPQEPERV